MTLNDQTVFWLEWGVGKMHGARVFHLPFFMIQFIVLTYKGSSTRHFKPYFQSSSSIRGLFFQALADNYLFVFFSLLKQIMLICLR